MLATATNPVKTGTKRAHVDRTGFQSVHIEKMTIPKPTPKIVAMAAKMEHRGKPQQKPCTHGQISSFERLNDETCSSCQPPPSAQEMIPIEWHHIPWDELEMKKHSLMDKRCHHFAEVPLPDEVEMKKWGLVDSQGHHVLHQLDEKDRQKAVEAVAKCHEKLAMAKRGKQTLKWYSKEPHVTISHDVEVCSGEEEDRDEDEDEVPSSSTTLTAHGSIAQQKPISSQESAQQSMAAPKAPSSAPTGKVEPERVESVQSSTRETIGAAPVVMTQAYQTEDGQFELTFNIQVFVKPKGYQDSERGKP